MGAKLASCKWARMKPGAAFGQFLPYDTSAKKSFEWLLRFATGPTGYAGHSEKAAIRSDALTGCSKYVFFRMKTRSTNPVSASKRQWHMKIA